MLENRGFENLHAISRMSGSSRSEAVCPEVMQLMPH